MVTCCFRMKQKMKSPCFTLKQGLFMVYFRLNSGCKVQASIEPGSFQIGKP